MPVNWKDHVVSTPDVLEVKPRRGFSVLLKREEMTLNICSALEDIISGWPGVQRRQEKTQIVLAVGGINFCWLSPSTGMVQVRPPLGPRSKTRRLRRVGNRVEVIRQKTGQPEVVYLDPGQKLLERFSYPGFMCSQATLEQAVDLVRQAYDRAKAAGPAGTSQWSVAKTKGLVPVNWKDHIVSTQDMLKGKPRIKKTRIPASLILGYLADGKGAKEITAEFPDLTEEQIAACLDYARELAEFEVVTA